LKLILAISVSAALAAGPALAQGTFNNGRKPVTGFGTPSSSAPQTGGYKPPGQAPAAGGQPRTYGAPAAAGGFKPYEGYKGSSVYSSKPSPPAGAKPCETSVYVNACKDR